MNDQLLNASFQAILAHHLNQYPELKVEDLYKLVYQGAMGSEHAVDDPDLAYTRLRSEANTLSPDTHGPVIDPVSPNYRLMRVNLGPYLATGGGLKELSNAFIKTSRTFKPSAESLSKYWCWAEAMAEGGRLSLSCAEMKSYGELKRDQGYPAVHHSDRYRHLYQPAYRVVLKELIDIAPK